MAKRINLGIKIILKIRKKSTLVQINKMIALKGLVMKKINQKTIHFISKLKN